MDTAILIPAYKPDESMIALINALKAQNAYSRILVVDDGSGEPFAPVFEKAAMLCEVVHHEVNRGKGAAIRTGLEILSGYNVVTADCDGQHTPEDIKKIASAIDNNLVLGVRKKREMPVKSYIGNILTCAVFALKTGKWISDTQTGLRGIPAHYIPASLTLAGDRYEYEMNMLMDACHRKLPIREIEIETVYIDNNRGTHFRALRDGLRIYKLILSGRKYLPPKK